MIMASTKSNDRTPKTQTKPKQSNQEWYEARYGEHRDRLSDERLKQLVEDICGKDYDSEAAAALVLLMDEFERSQFDLAALQNIVITVGSAAFSYTDNRAEAEHKLVLAMRKQYASQEVCHA
jgi:hypothetical protein